MLGLGYVPAPIGGLLSPFGSIPGSVLGGTCLGKVYRQGGLSGAWGASGCVMLTLFVLHMCTKYCFHSSNSFWVCIFFSFFFFSFS